MPHKREPHRALKRMTISTMMLKRVLTRGEEPGVDKEHKLKEVWLLIRLAPKEREDLHVSISFIYANYSKEKK